MEWNRKPKKGRAPDEKARRTHAEAGRSGRGSESVRPFLRAQLALRELLVPQFPPPEQSLVPIRKKNDEQ